MAKEVNFDGANAPQGQRLSAEQLTNVLDQVGAQNEQLRKQTKQLMEQLDNFRKNEFYLILDWNYKIATSDCTYFPGDFKNKCAERIQEMMTPKEHTEEPLTETE